MQTHLALTLIFTLTTTTGGLHGIPTTTEKPFQLLLFVTAGVTEVGLS